MVTHSLKSRVSYKNICISYLVMHENENQKLKKLSKTPGLEVRGAAASQCTGQCMSPSAGK